MHVMREEGRTGTASRAGRVARRALASVQVACALMLLVAGGVLLASLQRVLSVDVGFRTERLLTAQLNLSPMRYTTAADIQGLVDRLLDRVRQLPGIEAAGLASTTPFGGATSDNPLWAEGIRWALGADARRIFRLVLAEGGVIVGVGALAGLAGATLLRRTIEAQLYGIAVMDPKVLMAVGGGLAVIELLAITIPARRAARTEPTVALTDA